MSVGVYFGSETGNAEAIANTAAAFFGTTAKSLEGVTVADLKADSAILIVTSTWGDGEPPANAASFCENLKDSNESLAGTSFAVYGIGSQSFPQFCQTAIEIDEDLERLGSKRIVEVVKAEDDSDVDSWLNSLGLK